MDMSSTTTRPPQYPIRAVAKMTGLSLDTLRAWERRYQVVTPARDQRGRLYDDRDVERLKQLARLVDEGHAIGSLSALTSTALAKLEVSQRAPVRGGQVELAPLTRAMKQYDLQLVESMLNRHAAVLPPDALIFSVILPMLRETGARWEAGTIRPAQEHLVSATIRSILGALLRTIASPGGDEPMLFATLPGERHELGILSAAVLAAYAGRRVTYLGADVPAGDLVHAANATDASTLVLCATMPGVTSVRDVRVLRRLRPDVACWVGGPERARVRRELGTRARAIETLDQYAALIDRRRS
jgi:DNA-binding transcriptional MerR regulator